IKNLNEFSNDFQDINNEEIVLFNKRKDDLIIDNMLKLDVFIENLDEIIEDNIEEEVYNKSNN
ncbi:6606_t:CDS:1, partial [Funneliformis geosporum]